MSGVGKRGILSGVASVQTSFVAGISGLTGNLGTLTVLPATSLAHLFDRPGSFHVVIPGLKQFTSSFVSHIFLSIPISMLPYS